MKKRNLFNVSGMTAVLLLAFMVLAGCASYQPVDVTNTMAAQINGMKFHKLEPGEFVNTLYVNRTGSLQADLNKHEGGIWYRAHQDKIVSIEAVIKYTSYVFFVAQNQQWRVEYVD
jgi:hypothetical protein